MDPYHKISPDTAQNIQPVKSVPQVRPTPKTGTKPAARGDRVEISERARMMQVALEQIRKMPDVDEAKVARVKARIEAGTYKADSESVAEKMLREALLDGST